MQEALTALDATAQAELVRRKEVEPVDLVDAAIERIEHVNPLLNAVVTPMFEMAREAASGALPEGPDRGVRRRPLHRGLPVPRGLRLDP
jgi:amidase